MLTAQQIQEARAKLGTDKTPAEKLTGSSLLSKISGEQGKPDGGGAIQDIKETGQGIKDAFNKRVANASEIRSRTQAGEQGRGSEFLQAVGQVAGLISDVGGELAIGAGKAILGQGAENKVGQVVQQGAEKLMSIPAVQSLIAEYETLKETNPELAGNLDAAFNIASLIPVAKGGQFGVRALKEGAEAIADAGTTTAKTIARNTGKLATTVGESTAGARQIASDLVERAPRAVARGKEALTDAKVRRETLRTATPEIKQAVKVNLDDRIINTVKEADADTLNAYKQVLDIAEESPKKIGTKKQPSLVSGELAVKQFDTIDKAKKGVGTKIGDLVKKLSKTEKLDMQDSFAQVDDILTQQGITPTYTDTGVTLDFSGSGFAPNQRTKIQELYNLATEGGDSLSPKQIRDKDKLFSTMKRDARFEGISDIIVETPEGNRNLFDVFRDIYSNKLDTVSPELKKLNSEYRQYAQLTEDIEDSLFKTPNFNITKTTNPAEFAKTNLRRVFGEAQSSPVYEAVADAMDAASRGLGYKGASPKAVAEFAIEMRKLFPETIPKTGLQGVMSGSGIGDVVSAALKVGAPNVADQQKALRNLLNSLTTK